MRPTARVIGVVALLTTTLNLVATPANSIAAPAAAAIVPAMKLPWAAGDRGFTGGPHSPPIDYICNNSDASDMYRPVSRMSGLDFGLRDEEALAAAGGRIVFADSGSNLVKQGKPEGLAVGIDHGNGFATFYYHLASIEPVIKNGVDRLDVAQGTVLGKSGGNPKHLHLEFRNWPEDTPYPADGIVIDGYRPRPFQIRSDLSKGLNYQGTMTRGAETTEVFQYQQFDVKGKATCNVAARRTNGAEGTVVAGGGNVRSTNQRTTANGGGGGLPAGTAKLDLVFAIDTTGSMGDDIANAKTNATQLIASMKTLVPDTRIAVMDFRDFPSRTGFGGDYPYHVVQPFTADTTQARNAIQSLTLGFGGDAPETRYCALMHALRNDGCASRGEATSIGSWRSGASKAIIVMTDAAALDPEPFTGFTNAQVVSAARAGATDIVVAAVQEQVSDVDEDSGDQFAAAASVDDLLAPVRIYSVVVGGDPTALADSTALAVGTGGAVFTAATAGDVVDALERAINAIVVPSLPAPTCDSAAPAPGKLWPPNNEFIDVSISDVENATSIVLTSIRQDELTSGDGDALGLGGSVAKLRSARDGNGDGRVYSLAFTATGESGACAGWIKVLVPHDQGIGQHERGTAGDGGPLYDAVEP